MMQFQELNEFITNVGLPGALVLLVFVIIVLLIRFGSHALKFLDKRSVALEERARADDALVTRLVTMNENHQQQAGQIVDAMNKVADRLETISAGILANSKGMAGVIESLADGNTALTKKMDAVETEIEAALARQGAVIMDHVSSQGDKVTALLIEMKQVISAAAEGAVSLARMEHLVTAILEIVQEEREQHERDCCGGNKLVQPGAAGGAADFAGGERGDTENNAGGGGSEPDSTPGGDAAGSGNDGAAGASVPGSNAAGENVHQRGGGGA